MDVAFSEGPEVGMKGEGVGLCTLVRRTIVTSLQSGETQPCLRQPILQAVSVTKWSYDQVNLGNTADYTMHINGTSKLNIVNIFNLVFLKCF